MRNLTVDDILWHVDGSEVDFPGSADVNSTKPSRMVETLNIVMIRVVPVTAMMTIHREANGQQNNEKETES